MTSTLPVCRGACNSEDKRSGPAQATVAVKAASRQEAKIFLLIFVKPFSFKGPRCFRSGPFVSYRDCCGTDDYRLRIRRRLESCPVSGTGTAHRTAVVTWGSGADFLEIGDRA